MPMDVISAMLGVPPEDRDQVRLDTNDAMHREQGMLEIPASAQESMNRVIRYFVGPIKECQAKPQDDLISGMIGAELRDIDSGEMTKLSFEELIGFCILLGNAGQGHPLCIGKSLARQECRVAFEELLARFPDYAVDESRLEWSHNNNVRGCVATRKCRSGSSRPH